MFKKLFSKGQQKNEVNQIFENLSQRIDVSVQVSFTHMEFLALAQLTAMFDELREHFDAATCKQIDSLENAASSISNVLSNLPDVEDQHPNDLIQVELKVIEWAFYGILFNKIIPIIDGDITDTSSIAHYMPKAREKIANKVKSVNTNH